jgi:hypothetical protein
MIQLVRKGRYEAGQIKNYNSPGTLESQVYISMSAEITKFSICILTMV